MIPVGIDDALIGIGAFAFCRNAGEDSHLSIRPEFYGRSYPKFLGCAPNKPGIQDQAGKWILLLMVEGKRAHV